RERAGRNWAKTTTVGYTRLPLLPGEQHEDGSHRAGGDFDPSVPAHQAIPKALRLSGERLGVSVEPLWTHTSTLGPDVAPLTDCAGIWCVPASPYADADGALAAIRYARESGRPFLGTCGGFQHALIEYARNALGRAEADHAETSPDATMP